MIRERFTRLAAVVLTLVCLHWPLLAEEPSNPIVDGIRPQLKDPAKPFTLVVRLKVRDGRASDLEAAFAPAIKATVKEKGCLAYQLNRSLKTTGEYVVYERWANLDAIIPHLKSDYVQKLLSQLGELLDGSPDFNVMVPAAE
jgi:quinol monooxygenase YgiN